MKLRSYGIIFSPEKKTYSEYIEFDENTGIELKYSSNNTGIELKLIYPLLFSQIFVNFVFEWIHATRTNNLSGSLFHWVPFLCDKNTDKYHCTEIKSRYG